MKKEKSISTSHIKLYRIVTFCLASIFVLTYAFSFLYDKGWVGILITVLYIGFMIAYWYPSFIKNMRLLKQISYDQENLYVHEKEADTQIPLERIRDVEIVSLDGLYRFNLMDKEAYGEYILSKTSIWYPFNFKKVDKELNHVRYLINKRKRTVTEEQTNRLPSSTA